MIYRQNEWTEDALLALSTEDDRFDKKSGTIFPAEFKAKLAKAASAFANSNGGYIIVGMCDDKEKAKNGGKDFDGVAFKPKQGSFEEWLEDQISSLLSPSIQNYRVLPVKPKANESKIPKDKPVFVIEVDASEIAPHQSNVDRVYYYREGNDSKPATHYYLEGLRSVRRFVSPILVGAWLDTFLLPLDNFFKYAAEYYQKRDFFPVITDSIFSHGLGIKIKPEFGGSLSDRLNDLNAKQFSRRYPGFKARFAKYEELNERFNTDVRQLQERIARSSKLDNYIFNDFINSDEFIKVLERIGLRLDYDKTENRLRKLFEVCGLPPTSAKEPLLETIAAVVTYELLGSAPLKDKANAPPGSSNAMMFITAWSAMENGIFQAISEDASISEAKEICEATIIEIQEFTNNLSVDLDTEIELLTSRSGVPLAAVRYR